MVKTKRDFSKILQNFRAIFCKFFKNPLDRELLSTCIIAFLKIYIQRIKDGKS